jgi:hypothetical protein
MYISYNLSKEKLEIIDELKKLFYFAGLIYQHYFEN